MNSISSAAPCHVLRRSSDGGWDTHNVVAWTLIGEPGFPIGVILLGGNVVLAYPQEWTYVEGPAV